MLSKIRRKREQEDVPEMLRKFTMVEGIQLRDA